PLLSLSATDTAPTAIYTLSLHDALPISRSGSRGHSPTQAPNGPAVPHPLDRPPLTPGAACRLPTDPHWEIDMRLTPGILVGSLRSEEHTSELQSRENLVCRLLLEKKKNN